MNDLRLNRQLARDWLEAVPAVSAFVAALVPNHHQAADLVQRTALAVVEKYEEYDPARPFVGWALGIARYEVLNWRRSTGRDRHVFSDTAARHLEEAAQQLAPQVDARLQALQACVKGLAPRQAALVARRYRDGAEVGVLAREMGVARAALSMQLARIRQTLRRCVERRLAKEGV